MSWLFSQALVEEYSAGTSLAGAPSSQLNVTPTQHKFWRNDKTMDASDLSRFGLTLQLLTAGHGVELLMSYLAAFPVRTSAQLEPALASMANDPACGPTWRGSFAKYDPSGASTWRTPQCSLLGGSDEFSETWPRWGSMLNGVSYLRQIPALPICESGSGLWPTPTASLGTKGGRVTPRKGREGGTLIEAVSARRWPTPKANDAEKRGNFNASDPRNGLVGAVRQQEPGQLSPEWVEWLMGWPIGWTELKPLAMARFREWQQQHGLS
ncbi:hypothetical protein E7V67_011475 [[Empedobacter] haloabium]|uniref:Transposase n=1 Tax=[Empedobacter] haloabium TaxID=592317 RepID=A0ABZ1UTN7_9BURK